MNVLGVGMALLLPLLLGGACMLALLQRPRGAAQWVGLFGSGWLLGMLLIALLLHVPLRASPMALFAATLPWLLVALLLAASAAAWRVRSAQAPVPEVARRSDAVWWLLLGLVALHLLLAGSQALSLPTIPWDAWTAWLGRAKAWLGSAEAFSPLATPAEWMRSTDPNVRATLAPHYPEAVPRLALWMSSAAGGWFAAAVHLLWPALAVALAAGLYGQLRRSGLLPGLAMVATYACVSLPLLNAHVALAGYADLWMAAALLFAFLHWVHWRRARHRGDLALALFLALMLPMLKLEGAIWMACLFVAAAWGLLPGRWQLGIPLGLAVVAGVLLGVAGISLPLPGLGLVTISWGEVTIASMGTLQLYWRPVGAEVLAALFALPNWHLLWALLPAMLVLRWRVLAEDRTLRAVAAFLALAYAFVFVLFFFTDASAWAENLTSINRVLLHVAPATVAFLALLWDHHPAGDRADRSRPTG